MATSLTVTAGLRAQIDAFVVSLNSEIAGLKQLSVSTTSNKSASVVRDRLDRRQKRLELCTIVLNDLDHIGATLTALTADGFPDVTDPPISPEVMAELNAQAAGIAAAISNSNSPAPPPTKKP